MGKRLQVSDMIRTEIHNVSGDRVITSSRVWREVADVMSREVTVISPEASLLTAAETMSEKDVSCIVVQEAGQVVGILTETDFLEKVVVAEQDSREVRVADLMSSSVESIPPGLSVFEASLIMQDRRVKRLPVLEGKTLVGIVTQTDLVRALTAYGMWRSVADIMTREIAGVDRKATLSQAAALMHSRGVSCVFVLERGKAVGVLTKRDVLKRAVTRCRDPRQTTVDEVMSSPVIEVPVYYSVFSASRTMAAKHVRRLAVSEGDRLAGVVAQTDIFRAVGRKMQEEESQHVALLERSQNAVFTVDREGSTTYVNPALVRLFEVDDRTVFVGRPFLPERFWVNPEDRCRLVEQLSRESTDVLELALKTARGRTIHVALFFALTTNASGEVNGSQGVLYDVTEKRELAALRATQEALRESERRYRLLAENVKDVIWTSDLNLRWTYVSPSAELLRGYTVAETMAQTVREMLTPESLQVVLSELAEQLALAEQHRDAPTRSRTVEVELTRKDGTTVWTEAKVSFLCDANGEPVGLVGLARDITERKRAEQELKEYAVALESANAALREACSAAESATRAKTEFLANMSHEIRTPMTAILGFADVLADGLHQPEDVEAIQTIRRNGEYLLKVINDILDLSKIETGKLQVDQVRCSPRAIVEEVVSLMKVRAGAKGLALGIENAGEIPATIVTDPLRLKQILINLIGNAVKFTHRGGVRVVLEVVRGAKDRPQLRFDVIDTGIGMDPGQLRRLFNPFIQGDPSTTRKFGGSGLGLTIAKRMAGLLGGDVTVESTPGEGSTFTATVSTVPLEGAEPFRPSGSAEERPGDGPDPRSAGHRPKVGPGRSPSGTRAMSLSHTSGQDPAPEERPLPAQPRVRLDCRVLMAEDGPDNQRLISLVLEKAGAEVTVVENGQEALDKVLESRAERAGPQDRAAGPFDVILMDMQMPVMDGYEATRRLRDAGCRDPIIALTANAMKGDRQKCLDAGCDDYVAKPINRGQLLELVAQYAGVSRPA
jgi:PAS domain S-box-containing protein